MQERYSEILDLLKCELEEAKIAFDQEEAAIRAGARTRARPRPAEEGFRRALVRFSRCLLDGIIPPELLT
jgi:hypothetical protein